MKEIRGYLWDYYVKPDHVICITTNGMVKKNGEGVCGRGCARQAVDMIPHFARLLGDYIKQNGNVPGPMAVDPTDWPVIIFPVKHKFYETADVELIEAGVKWLTEEALRNPSTKYVLPRPGCGNGGMTWDFVKPLCKSLPDNVLVITF